MIGRLTGRVVDHEAEHTVVLDVSGVGYELQVPLGTVGRARAEADGRTTIFVHTHVREDAITLFGFASDTERTAFRTLIGVSNVGPKIAMAVLSALPADELARAIAAKDVPRLTAISGVGKKTAERLVLELRDKLPTVAASPAPTRAVARAGSNAELLRSALANMSFRPAEIDRALATLEADLDTKPLAELIRDALALLAR
jgi:Holliday junction DNA helicase RuvA